MKPAGQILKELKSLLIEKYHQIFSLTLRIFPPLPPIFNGKKIILNFVFPFRLRKYTAGKKEVKINVSTVGYWFLFSLTNSILKRNTGKKTPNDRNPPFLMLRWILIHPNFLSQICPKSCSEAMVF